MAKKEAYYFSHDSNARNDEKMMQLRSVYRSEGYGWYWILVEMMRDANAYSLQCDGKYAFNAIAKELDCTEDQAKKFIDDCIHEFKLFDSENGLFFSKSLIRRMDIKEEKREKARQSARARWDNNSNAMRTHTERNANGMQGKESKGKEKEIESKELKFDFSKLELGSGELELARLSIKGEKGFMPEDKPIQDAFKLFRGMHAEDAYPSKSEFYKHFYNWVKKQTFNPSTKMEAWRAI